MSMGIYMILNFSTNKFYIGRAFNLDARWHTHSSALNRNIHPNEYLQNAWNKYGKDDFKLYILEIVYDKSLIIEREQHWLDKLDACNKSIGFNLNPSAANSLGYKHSEEVKLKIKENSIRLGLKPPDPTGRKHSEETKIKQSMRAKGKLKSDQHKKRLSEARRDKTKWPHEGGRKCNCRDCQDKKNMFERENYQKRRLANAS